MNVKEFLLEHYEDQFDQARYFPLFSVKERDKILNKLVELAEPFCELEGAQYYCAWHKVREAIKERKKLIVNIPGKVKIWEVHSDLSLNIPVYQSTRSFEWARFASSNRKDDWRMVGVNPEVSVFDDVSEILNYLCLPVAKQKDSFASSIIDAFPGFRSGGNVNGADLVDFVASYLCQAGLA